jgi:hypothetical protein
LESGILDGVGWWCCCGVWTGITEKWYRDSAAATSASANVRCECTDD